MRTALKLLAIYAALSLLLVALSLPSNDNHLPSTPAQWLWLLLLTPVVYIAGELIGSLFFDNRISRFVDQKTDNQSFSALRILYLLLALFAGTATLLGAAYLWRLLTA